MEKQNAVERLRESIRVLEIRQAEEGEILKQQFKVTYESLKPVNLIRSSLKDITSSAELKGDLFEAVIALVSGYFTKKMMVGSKSNVFTRTLGLVMQFGVTNFVARNADNIREFFSGLIDKFFKSPEEKEQIPENQ